MHKGELAMEVLEFDFPSLCGLKKRKDLTEAVLEDLRQLKHKHGKDKLGYVAGMITSEGPQYVARNLQALQAHTKSLREAYDFPIFCSADVFRPEVFKSVHAECWTTEDWDMFWREILSAGIVTDIFMTPRWKMSHGARLEHETALHNNIKVWDLECEDL